MPKIKKVHRRKRYNANINRKRLKNKMRKMPTIGCKEIKNAWEVSKSTRVNLKEMGLAYDPNEVIPVCNKQEVIQEQLVKVVGPKELNDKIGKKEKPFKPSKKFIAEALEADAKAPRQKLFRMPNGDVRFVTYMLDKYGEDYEAMARDAKNYYQMTWKQIRAKINKFKKIPEQYNEYLEKKNEETD